MTKPVKYADMRSTIQTGDVLAWSEGGVWNSWRNFQLNLVRMGTLSTYNHVGIAYVLLGRVFVVEAVVPLIRIFPLSQLTPFYHIPTEYRLDEAKETKLLARVGLPYSKWEAIKSAFSKDTNGQKVWQCSKLVNQTLMDFDKSFDDLYDTPQAVVEYLMASGCTVTEVVA